MRTLMFILLMPLCNYMFSQSDDVNISSQEDGNLVGEWILDLRPSPDAGVYLQTLIISTQDDTDLTGLFYGSPIEDVFVNESWEKTYFGFKSSDKSNNYYQSGYIIGDTIFGITYCPGRNFVMPWTGKKKVE